MGFPNRLTRSQLGPRMRDNRAVQNPETDVGQQLMNDLMDQTAGMNVVVPRVAIVAKWNSFANLFDIYHQAEAWNPDGSQPHPVLARQSSGRYTYTFAGNYLDGQGVAVPTVLIAPRVFQSDPQIDNTTPALSWCKEMAWVDQTNPLQINIAFNNGGYVDLKFWLEVL